MVSLNGPVKNALFCLMDRYRNVCVWFMQGTAGSKRLELTVANVESQLTIARHCRFPQVRSHGSQPGTAGSQRLELMLPNLGTRGHHCKELPVPEVRIYVFEAKRLSL